MPEPVDRVTASVTPVWSADAGSSVFGTAFVVRHDGTTSYLVTCAHVVRDVGGPGQVTVAGRPARVVAAGSPDGADDVAVLATDRLDAPPLRLAAEAERDRAVVVVGFRPVQADRRLVLAAPVEATLGARMALAGPGGRTDAWPLLFADGRGISGGFSGSPIVDARTGEVVAIAAYREDSDRAIAVSTTALGPLWPESLPSPVVAHRGIELVHVPASRFTMGTPQRLAEEYAEQEDRASFRAEAPRHELDVPGFYLARFPVTNRQYAEFVAATGHRVPFRDDAWSRPYSWDPAARTPPAGKEELPVVLVSWHDALAYCDWLGARLPTEAEWEKAASGREPRTWPWGDVWDPGRCNTEEGARRECLPVGDLPGGESPYGVHDLAGNVWEWCASAFAPYPYRADDGRESRNALGDRVLRGGAWGNSRWIARCAAREHARPDDFGFTIGFRVALSPDALSGEG